MLQVPEIWVMRLRGLARPRREHRSQATGCHIAWLISGSVLSLLTDSGCNPEDGW
jgi:hypothetical protein